MQLCPEALLAMPGRGRMKETHHVYFHEQLLAVNFTVFKYGSSF